MSCRKRPGITVLFIDVETSGLDPRRNVILSLGACLARHHPAGAGPVDLAVFEDQLVYDPRLDLEGAVDEQALEVNGLDLDHVRAEGLPPERAMNLLKGWLLDVLRPGDLVDVRGEPRHILGGQNFGCFDYPFLMAWREHYGVELPRHSRRFVDTATLLHLLRTTAAIPPDVVSLAQFIEAGFAGDYLKPHSAADDAQASAMVFRRATLVSAHVWALGATIDEARSASGCPEGTHLSFHLRRQADRLHRFEQMFPDPTELQTVATLTQNIRIAESMLFELGIPDGTTDEKTEDDAS